MVTLLMTLGRFPKPRPSNFVASGGAHPVAQMTASNSDLLGLSESFPARWRRKGKRRHTFRKRRPRGRLPPSMTNRDG